MKGQVKQASFEKYGCLLIGSWLFQCLEAWLLIGTCLLIGAREYVLIMLRYVSTPWIVKNNQKIQKRVSDQTCRLRQISGAPSVLHLATTEAPRGNAELNPLPLNLQPLPPASLASVTASTQASAISYRFFTDQFSPREPIKDQNCFIILPNVDRVG